MSEKTRSTTVVCVKKGKNIVMASDGQVSLGNTIMKGSAKKVRKIHNNSVIVGFAGAAADAFSLVDKLEKYLENYSGDVVRACVELAKEWRSDKILRKLEALILVASVDNVFLISGNGDLLSPDHDIIAIGSGGNYAYAAGIALMENAPSLTAKEIAQKSLEIAASICVFTNDQLSFEELGE